MRRAWRSLETVYERNCCIFWNVNTIAVDRHCCDGWNVYRIDRLLFAMDTTLDGSDWLGYREWGGDCAVRPVCMGLLPVSSGQTDT